MIDKNSSIKQIILDLKNMFLPMDEIIFQINKNIEFTKISKRHRQLINFLDQGYSNLEISQHLNISENTVKIHFYRLYKILNVKSRLEALNFAKENGWLSNRSHF